MQTKMCLYKDIPFHALNFTHFLGTGYTAEIFAFIELAFSQETENVKIKYQFHKNKTR